ncbi:MAG TPA: polyphosphate kinase 2 family protein [Chthoniobacterales bacterium]
MKSSAYHVKPGSRVRLASHDPGDTGHYKDKHAARTRLAEDILEMQRLQDIFYAADSYSLLIIFQALDAAGKDGAIKHVMSGLNPQGCQVAAFKSPSATELDHDYLWRCNIRLPERGRIGIFNRSYNEDVLAVRVHPEYLAAQKLPPKLTGANLWKRRFEEISHYEKYLADNGTRILKFFLHVSKDEQKRRFLERIENPDKNWKLSPSDVKERQHWHDYEAAYEDLLSHTSTDWAPWYVIPADKKWFSRTLIANVIVRELQKLKLSYPKVSPAHLAAIQESKAALLAEKD